MEAGFDGAQGDIERVGDRLEVRPSTKRIRTTSCWASESPVSRAAVSSARRRGAAGSALGSGACRRAACRAGEGEVLFPTGETG